MKIKGSKKNNTGPEKGNIEAQNKAPEFERVSPDPNVGLTSEQVAARVAAGAVNESVASPTKTVGRIIRDNVCTYFNLIFALLAIALIAVGSFAQLTFLAVIVANTMIGIVQEINAKKTLDRLSIISEPTATAVRDGKEQKIPADKIVLDDIVIFSAGNQIGADASVAAGEIQVNESLVTGESDEITKRAGDKLLSGSFVVSGKCRAKIEAVGKDSFVSGLTLAAKKAKKKEKPGMMRALTRLVQIIGIIIIPVGIIMFWRQKELLSLATQANVEKTTAALIGMIPEGLYLLVSMALAVSVVRLAKKKTLVHDLGCIETLARVDVLCVDKTGTITENVMLAERVISFAEANLTEGTLEKIIADFVGNMNADNNTMEALKEAYARPTYRRAERVVPFSSKTKFSAVSFSDEESYLVGAPEFLLGENYGLYRERVEEHTVRGYRVVMVARAGKRYDDGTFDRLTPLGLILLSNKIRPEAKATFEYFARQKVNIKVISGDNPITVADAARRAGIESADKYIDASTLNTPEKLERAVLEYTVFGRVTPDQKKQFVKILKDAGHTVAMTGDGVNDVLALKSADCSIAMASGSEVACQVSDLVLLDSDFSSMPSVVAEGRRVINNIERAASLFLVKNIFSFVLAIISIFAVFEYPFTPTQLSLISAITIGIPSFFLALEPNENLIKGNFLVNVIVRALPAALTDLFVILFVILFSQAFSIGAAITSTITALLVCFVGLFAVYKVCQPLNEMRIAVLGLVLVLFILAVSIIPSFFDISPLNFGGVLILIVFMLLIPTVQKVATVAVEKAGVILGKAYNKVKAVIKKNMID